MAVYSYVAFDANGKEKRGKIESSTKESALEELRSSGLTVGSLGEGGGLNQDIDLPFSQKKPSSRDLAVFSRQIVSIIDAGVTITAALQMLSEQTENKMLKEAITACHESVLSGTSLSEAMSYHEEVFPNLLVTMVEAGEASGSLDVSFTRMADQFEKDAKLSALIKKASVYPIAVLVVAFGVIMVLLGFVIPQFEQVLGQLGTELPWITKAVIVAGDFVANYWVAILVVIGVGGYGAYRYGQTEPGKYLYGSIEIRLPLFGILAVKSASARLCRTLSTMLAAGIGITDALVIVGNVMSNVIFKETVMNAKTDVELGTPLSEPIARSELFPPLVHHMIKIGEDTGNLESMLDKLADYYDEEVEIATASIMTAIEPLIIVVLAAIVGVIVLAVVLPLGEMTAGVGNL